MKWLAVLGGLWMAGGVLAAEASLDSLREAVGRADWPTAEAALQALAAQPAVDQLEVRFLDGMMWAARGDLPRATKAFRSVVDARPELPRPRLELARVLFLQGDDEAARYHFERVMAADVPAAVADNIRSFLEAIRRRNAWSFDLTLAPVADDNLNGGTARDTVDLGGLTFNVNPDAKAVRGHGLITALRARKLVPAEGAWRHELAAGFVYKNYNKHAYDDTFSRVGYGLRRVTDATGSEWGGGVFAIDRRVGDAPFSRSRGGRLDVRWPVGRAWRVDAVAERQWVRYHATEPRDGPLTWLSIGTLGGLDAATMVAFNLDHLREQAAAAEFRLTSRGIGAAIYRELPRAWTTGPNGRLAVTTYDAPAPLFNRERRDTDRSLGWYLAKKDWLFLGLHPSLSLSREWRASSIDFFSYRRNRFLLAFERRF